MKAQSSFEFMSTYVWAGIALIIAIGAIGYFANWYGSGSVEDEFCDFGVQLKCVDTALNEGGYLAIQLRSEFTRDIIIKDVTITGLTEEPLVSTYDVIVSAGTNRTLIINLHKIFVEDEKLPYAIEFSVQKDGPRYTILGEAQVAVQNYVITSSVCGNGIAENGERCDQLSGCRRDEECTIDCTICNPIIFIEDEGEGEGAPWG